MNDPPRLCVVRVEVLRADGRRKYFYARARFEQPALYSLQSQSLRPSASSPLIISAVLKTLTFRFCGGVTLDFRVVIVITSREPSSLSQSVVQAMDVVGAVDAVCDGSAAEESSDGTAGDVTVDALRSCK